MADNEEGVANENPPESTGLTGGDEGDEESPSAHNGPQVESEPETLSAKIERCLNFLLSIYKNRYHWELVKSTIMFALGLKVAQECYHIVIPIKEYQPFQGVCNGCTSL